MSAEEFDETTDPDARLEALFDSIRTLQEKCLIATALRTTLEARRLAKAERRLVPYLTANFYVMNLAQDLFDPDAGREAAIENIAMLESAERARAFQADYDEAEYEGTVQWMSACSYDNLATATGMRQGYNSAGMQACIADGIGVCRRTGKTQCIACFREYATNVHRSADDLAMAMHHARTNLTVRPDGTSGGKDRRFVGARDLSDLLLLTGDLQAAYDAAVQGVELTETYHFPLSGRRKCRSLMRQIGHLVSRDDWVTAGTDPAADRTPRGEDAAQDLRDDLADALADAARDDWVKAIERLTPWDRHLSDRNCLHSWFEVRLHLIALLRRAGKEDRAAALAKPLKKRAGESGDFLTLRRLEATLAGGARTSPFPTVGPLTAGRFALPVAPSAGAAGAEDAVAPAASDAQTDRAAAAGEAQTVEAAATPLGALLGDLAEQMNGALQRAAEAGEAPDFSPVVDQILAMPPERIADPDDAGRLLHLLTFTTHTPVPHERMWQWATAAAEQHPAHPKVTAIRAQIGDMLRSSEDSPLAESLPSAEIEAMFRKAMDLDPSWAGSFRRAGIFFLREGNDAEAERCLARAFRLDRSDAQVASQLADVYAGTDRPGDALAVLDMCLRAGTESPDLLWNAGVRAVGLGRHASALTYLDRLDEIEPGRPWVHYYRGLALLALNRPAEATEAAEREGASIERPGALHVQSIRAVAAAQLDRPDDVRQHLEAALTVPLGSIDDLTLAGITSCHERMWSAAVTLPAADPTRQRVIDRLLASGLTPDALWDWHRAQAEEPVAGLSHYLFDLHQPLGADWAESPACPPGFEGWKAYAIRYGALAESEEAARQMVQRWQAQSAPRPAEVLEVQQDGGTYTDRPGVTWRTAPAEAEARGEP